MEIDITIKDLATSTIEGFQNLNDQFEQLGKKTAELTPEFGKLILSYAYADMMKSVEKFERSVITRWYWRHRIIKQKRAIEEIERIIKESNGEL